MSDVVVLEYNAGNTLSVVSALRRLGVSPVITNDNDKILSASRIVFPGVGHAKPAADYLRSRGLDQILRNAKQPVLGICLGMQLLCQHTEEGETAGIGIFSVRCTRFRNQNLKIPHMGWNEITNLKGPLFKDVPEKSFLYFVHSYRLDACEQTAASSTYGESFSAAIQTRNFFGVQFHPEKSSACGAKILENFLSI